MCSPMFSDQLVWFPERGIGWYPVTESPYDAEYLAKLRAMDKTDIGDKLNRARCNWVSKYYDGRVCDIGVGGGRFVLQSGASGYDINPHAVEWLHDQGRFVDPYKEPQDALTFWDSMEHIHDPAPLLENAMRWVFASLPIFTGPDHILRSKHFRRNEHCWYFTTEGFIGFMDAHGFDVRGISDMETKCGREDIKTFAFERRNGHG
jgi:hypothetical protein